MPFTPTGEFPPGEAPEEVAWSIYNLLAAAAPGLNFIPAAAILDQLRLLERGSRA